MGLVSDPYTFANGATADGEQVNDRFDAILAVVNGAVDERNISPAVRAILGLSDATSKRRGVTVIAGSETRTSTSYGMLSTPDRVQGVVVPSNGLLFIAYQALWNAVGSGYAQARITLNGVPLKVGDAGPTNADVETNPMAATTNLGHLATHSGGLSTVGNTSAPASQATTGQVVSSGGAGGPVAAFANAGTYDVAVQFKVDNPAVTINVRNRKLWVWTQAF